MPRPQKAPFLSPRQPKTVLGWSMQKLRQVHSWSGRDVAKAFGCSASHVSRVEHGTARPSRALVQFYEDTFNGDGVLLSLFEVVEHASEQARRRGGGRPGPLARAVPGDASTFVDDTIPHGTCLRPGAVFVKQWRIQNSGQVAWRSRRLERQGPTTGPGLITSPDYVVVPNTDPGGIATIDVAMKAPTYDCSSIAYFKMVDTNGQLCFPDNYTLGLDVLVLVRGQRGDKSSEQD